MHEYSLFSQIPHGRHEQVINIFAGVTAAPPRRVYEQSLVYRQIELAKAAGSKKAAVKLSSSNQQQRLYHHKLVRDVTFEDEHLVDVGPWRHRIEDVPEPGVKAIISRSVTETMLKEADLEKFRGGSALYKYVDQFLLSGQRFVDSDVVIKISNLLRPPEGTGALEPLDAPMPKLNEFRLFDRSGAYLIDATVRVTDGTDSNLSEQATQQLLALKKTLEGAIDLRVPDRLAMDTRVKAVDVA